MLHLPQIDRARAHPSSNAATTIQSLARSKAVRRTSLGTRAAQRAELKRLELEQERQKKLQEAEEKRLAERRRVATLKFEDADLDKGGTVDKEELGVLLANMLQELGLDLEQSVIDSFVATQFDAADVDDDGSISLEEFIQFYDDLVDNLEEGSMVRSLEEQDAASRAQQAAELQLRQDVASMEALMKFLAVLTNDSVGPVASTQLLFERDADGIRPLEPPTGEDDLRTTQGIAIDISRFGQRLVTPWGSFLISHNLIIEQVYNPAMARGEDEVSVLRQCHSQSFYFLVSRRSSQLLHFRQVGPPTRFALAAVMGDAVAVGDIVGERGRSCTAPLRRSLAGRFHKARSLAQVPQLPSDKLLINAVVGEVVAVDQKKLRQLGARFEKKTRRTKHGPEWTQERLARALKLADNDTDQAEKLSLSFAKGCDNLVESRKGFSTRARCEEVLDACNWDYDAALFVLDNEAAYKANMDAILKKRSLETGLLSNEADVLREVAMARNDEKAAVRHLSAHWRLEVRWMHDVLRNDPVDEILAVCAELASFPGREHVAALLREHGRGDKEFVTHLLTRAASVLSHGEALGGVDRLKVEELLLKFDFDERKTLALLSSTQYIYRHRRQVRLPTREPVPRARARAQAADRRARMPCPVPATSLPRRWARRAERTSSGALPRRATTRTLRCAISSRSGASSTPSDRRTWTAGSRWTAK